MSQGDSDVTYQQPNGYSYSQIDNSTTPNQNQNSVSVIYYLVKMDQIKLGGDPCKQKMGVQVPSGICLKYVAFRLYWKKGLVMVAFKSEPTVMAVKCGILVRDER